MESRIVSIDVTALTKGQSISGDLAWDHFATRKPEKVAAWITEHGDESVAKAIRLPQVLLWVRDWLDRDRRQAGLPPLVMSSSKGSLRVLTDEEASAYLNDQAFQGLRKHQRATGRLLTAVDDSALTPKQLRDHQHRLNVHSFIAASTQGAQQQLRTLQKAGKGAPKLLE